MFFPERVKSIKPGDKVLEIGPGATPHPKSTIFLEKKFETEEEYVAQSGHVGILQTDKEIVYYDGDVFPFEDKSFDYVICSHVLEHVDDVPKFLSEIFRIGKRGYLEFPTIYYDYLHNIEEHLNMLLCKDNKILWCKKDETPIPSLTPFTNYFREVQFKGYRFQKELNQYLHQGFEWDEEIENIRVSDWKELTYPKEKLQDFIKHVSSTPYQHELQGVGFTFKHLLKEVKHKLKGKS